MDEENKNNEENKKDEEFTLIGGFEGFIIVFITALLLIAFLCAPSKASAAVEVPNEVASIETQKTQCRASKITRPVIIKLSAVGNDKDGYKKISLRLSAPNGIKSYYFNGHRYQGNGKNVIDINNITYKTQNANIGRNTIYVYDKKNKECSWAFNLVKPKKTMKAPIIQIREDARYTVRGKKENHFKKISFIFKGKGVFEYGFNGGCFELEDPVEKYYLNNIDSDYPGCHKGRNRIWIYDDTLQEGASFIFYLD